jgi:membrane-associated phospholipid phosphatase
MNAPTADNPKRDLMPQSSAAKCPSTQSMIFPLTTSSVDPWHRVLKARFWYGLAATVIGTSLLTAVFFLGYFYVQAHPLRTPYVMPLTSLDRLIPFQPKYLSAYLSLWVYIGAGPGLLPSHRERLIYAAWISALGLIGLAIFWIWPTQVPRVFAPGAPALMMLLHGADAAGNACPSMHVAMAVFTVIRVDNLLQRTRSPWYLRALNLVSAATIAYSTLAIQQHVLWDVIAGAALGAAFALVSMAWPRPPRRRTTKCRSDR